MSRSVSLYRYQALLPGLESIRLLRLLPHKDENALIQCQLFNYSLGELDGRPHPYDALSYVWGDESKPQSISIDGYDLPVTIQLYLALLRLRHSSIERIIWVDAVCINQEDEHEKERQIPLMQQIFGHANCVVIWLGEEADNSDQALEEIRIAGSEKTINVLHDEIIQQAVLKLLQRPWFRRIWVVEQALDNISTSTKSLI
jgi:hypothetical protein